MNTNVIIGILVALAIGLGLWLTFGIDRAEAPDPATTNSEANSAAVESQRNSSVGESFTGVGSFLELMGMGRNLTCDFDYVDPDTDGSVAGTVQISRERMRGDFQMQQAGEVYTSHMIQDEEMLYTWTETPDGLFALKMPISEYSGITDMPAAPTVPEEQPVSLDNDVDYDCRPWGVDANAFVPPADIEFKDMQEMMKGFEMPMMQ